MSGRPTATSRVSLLTLTAALAISAAPTLIGVSAGPRLVVTMVVDRLVVERGGLVTYGVRIDNVGNGPAATVGVTSHLPQRTEAATGQCREGAIEPDGDVCVHVEVPTPGIGEDVHQVGHTRVQLAAGSGFTLTFTVRVDHTAPVGTRLANHAHASLDAGPELDTAAVDTLVVAEVPDAVAGTRTMDLSGAITTDSYDSTIGPYALTRAATGGNLATNGDIALGGEVLVNGDATPGPGHAVTLGGAAQVTGSTAAATSEFVVNPVAADQYASSNANERLCATPGSCVNASFDPTSRVLAVTGSARVGPGAYFLCGLEVRGRLTFEGPADVWIGSPEVCLGGGNVLLRSAAVVETASRRPLDLRLRLQSGATGTAVDLGGGATFIGTVYAPASHLEIHGGTELFGGATAGTLAVGAGGGRLHLDRAIAVGGT